MTRAVFPLPSYERAPEYEQVPVDEETMPDPAEVESIREHIRRMSGRELASMAACYGLVFVAGPVLIAYVPEVSKWLT